MPQGWTNSLSPLLSLLEERTLTPNVRWYDDGVVTIEARLNGKEQLFAQVECEGQVEAVVYIEGAGAVSLPSQSVPELTMEVLERLDRLRNDY